MNAEESREMKEAIISLFEGVSSLKDSTVGSIDDLAHRFGLAEYAELRGEVDTLKSIRDRVYLEEDDELLKLSSQIAADLQGVEAIASQIGKLERLAGGSRLYRQQHVIAFGGNKPDIRLVNLIDRELEFVNKAGNVVFVGNIIKSGLSWRILFEWHQNEHQFSTLDQAMLDMHRKLLSCLSQKSPAEKIFFDSYWKLTIDNLDAPALIAQVWLRYDPKTVLDRNDQSLMHHRMDFAIFLAGGKTVIMEIDGRDHYGDEQDAAPPKFEYPYYTANPDKYAKMMKADRELKFKGYEVLRYGAKGINVDNIDEEIKSLMRFYAPSIVI